MKEEQLKDWTKSITGDLIEMSGMTATSRNPSEAIRYSKLTKRDHDNGLKAYIFVFTISTNEDLISLDSEDWSAYPHEKEILICECMAVIVWAREVIFSRRYK